MDLNFLYNRIGTSGDSVGAAGASRNSDPDRSDASNRGRHLPFNLKHIGHRSPLQCTESPMIVMSPGPSTQRSRKRKRNEIDARTLPHIGNVPAVIRFQPVPEAAAYSKQPIELLPKLLIPKPFLASTHSESERTRDSGHYTAHIDVFGITDEEYGKGEPDNVLVAASIDGTSVYAVERAGRETYALSSLKGWISLEQPQSRPAKKGNTDAKDKSKPVEGEGKPWWDRAAASLPSKDSQIGGTAPKPISRPSTATSAPSVPQRTNSAPTVILPDIQDANTQTTWEEVATILRTKYLEALYVSKTSLAYFAKGPLSRARNASAATSDQSHESSFLGVLTEMVVSVAVGEKKYSSALPELISEIPVGATEADFRSHSLAGMQDKIKKSRKRKRMSKYGFLPSEEEYVCQWWLEKENSTEAVGIELSHGERMKLGLAKQRTRETQLQVIILLESLAALNAKPEDGPTGENDGILAQKAAEKCPKKSKRPVDVQALLDILVDRLCIWQTTQPDEGGDMFGKRAGLGAAGGGGGSSGSLQAAKSNVLQDFCTEVLVPFYAGRLPKVFSSMCQKMGTVGVTSPARPALKKVGSGSQLQAKPGSAMSRRGLKRVATEGNSALKRVPSLARSCTDSSALGVKRESTDLLLADVPMHKPTTLQDRRYSQREVDIAAISKATKARQERKAFLDRELASAIDVLKKPNSRAAVRELVDLADERHAGTGRSTSKRKREPLRNGSGFNSGGASNSNSNSNNNNNGVHVKATPRANRWHPGAGRSTAHAIHPYSRSNDIAGATATATAAVAVAGAGTTTTISFLAAATAPNPGDAAEFPPSSEPRVPSSSKRLPAEKLLPVVRSTAIAAANPAFTVEATPMKRRTGSEFTVSQSQQQQQQQQERWSGPIISAIESTPSRGVAGRTMLLNPSLLADSELEEDELSGPSPSRFVGASVGFLAETPVKQRGRFLMPDMPTPSFLVSATPSKTDTSTSSQRVSTDQVRTPQILRDVGTHTNAPVTGSAALVEGDERQPLQHREHQDQEEVDLYKALGWDDEQDDDLI